MVTEEKQASKERLAELETQQEELTAKVKGKAAASSANVFEELQEQRRSRQETKGNVPSKNALPQFGQDEGAAGVLWNNMRGASASALSSLCKNRQPGPRAKAESGQEFVMTGAGSTKDKGCKDLVL